MAGPHDDLQKELARLRKENKILRELGFMVGHTRFGRLMREKGIKAV